MIKGCFKNGVGINLGSFEFQGREKFYNLKVFMCSIL